MQLRRWAGRPGCGARHLRSGCRDLRLPAGRSLPFLNRHHRCSAASREAHRRPARLAADLGSEFDHFQQVALAILTTDTEEKTAYARLEIPGPDGALREVHIAALCKGSGMIHPQLVPHATMLVYILTDAQMEPTVLDGYLRQAIEVSFNRISVDGIHRPTTPCCCWPRAQAAPWWARENAAFASALRHVTTSLARQIVADGEGVTHVIELHIGGCVNRRRRVAHRQGHRSFAAGEDRLVRQRPQLGPPDGGHRLLRRPDRPRAHRHPLRELAICRMAAVPRSSTRPPRTPYIARPEFQSPSNSTRAPAPASSGPPT